MCVCIHIYTHSIYLYMCMSIFIVNIQILDFPEYERNPRMLCHCFLESFWNILPGLPFTFYT